MQGAPAMRMRMRMRGPSYIPDGGRNRLEGEIPCFLTCLTRSSVLPEHKFPWLTLPGANMTSDCFADNCSAGPIEWGGDR